MAASNRSIATFKRSIYLGIPHPLRPLRALTCPSDNGRSGVCGLGCPPPRPCPTRCPPRCPSRTPRPFPPLCRSRCYRSSSTSRRCCRCSTTTRSARALLWSSSCTLPILKPSRSGRTVRFFGSMEGFILRGTSDAFSHQWFVRSFGIERFFCFQI